MSKGMRIALAVALLILGGGFLALVPFMAPVSQQAGPGMAVLGLFCALGATACLWRSSHPLTIRAIGGMVFIACSGYLINQVREFAIRPDLATEFGGRSTPNVINSLALMLMVGLPAGYAALKGRYPGWGNHSSAFGAEATR